MVLHTSHPLRGRPTYCLLPRCMRSQELVVGVMDHWKEQWKCHPHHRLSVGQMKNRLVLSHRVTGSSYADLQWPCSVPSSKTDWTRACEWLANNRMLPSRCSQRVFHAVGVLTPGGRRWGGERQHVGTS